MKLKEFLKFIVFLALGVGILVFMFHKNNVTLSELINSFKNLNYVWVCIALILYLSAQLIRAYRWKVQLNATNVQLSFSDLFHAMMFGYLINYAVARSGEVAKCGLLQRKTGASASVLFGTVVTERIIDLICFGAFLCIAFLLEFDKLWGYLNANVSFPSKWPVYIAIIAASTIIGCCTFIFRENIKKWRLYKKVEHILIGFKNGLLSIKKLERPVSFIVMTIGIWVLYLLMHYVVFFAYEPTSHLGIQVGIMTFVFGSLGIIVPAPGGIGAYQFFVQQALLLYAISADESFIFANVVFWPFVITNVLFGGVASYILLKKPSK